MDGVTRCDIRSKDHITDLSHLLHEISRKDTDALEDLFLQCRKGIQTVAYSITRDMQISEDVLQEAILYIWNHAGEFRNGGHPKAWIYMIVRHLSIDMVRKKHDWVSIEEFDDQPLPEELTTNADLDSEITLRTGIDQLGTVEAQIFVLKTIVGFSHYETARLMKISYRSVQHRYRSAISKLKKILAE